MGAIIGALIICGVWYFIEKLIDEKKEQEEFQRRQREELNRIIEADNKRKEEENRRKEAERKLLEEKKLKADKIRSSYHDGYYFWYCTYNFASLSASQVNELVCLYENEIKTIHTDVLNDKAYLTLRKEYPNAISEFEKGYEANKRISAEMDARLGIHNYMGDDYIVPFQLARDSALGRPRKPSKRADAPKLAFDKTMVKQALSYSKTYWSKRENEIKEQKAQETKRYDEIKSQFPNGLKIWETMHPARTIKDAITALEEIAKLEVLSIKIDRTNKIVEGQNEFSQKCRNLHGEYFDNWGCYSYNIEVDGISAQGSECKRSLKIWQFFCDSYCIDDTFVNQSWHNAFLKNREFFNLTRRYLSHVNDRVVKFIEKLCELYPNDNIVPLFVRVPLDYPCDLDLEEYFKHHFDYLYTQLESRGFVDEDTLDIFYNDSLEGRGGKVVVIDLISPTSKFNKTCSRIFSNYLNREGELPNIIYISFRKEYTTEEVNEIIRERERKEREKAAAEERARQEARRKEQEIQEAKNILSQYGDAAKRCGCSYSIYSLSYDQAKNVLRKKGEIEALSSKINRLRNAVSGWNSIKGIIPHYFFYYYYPTRFTNVTLTSDRARRLIWNFKDGMRSSEVANLVANKLKQTFISSDLGGLCFMCVPASTRITNENRYRAFAERVCSETGMTNGFRYISIVRDKEPSHLGGTTPAEYSYDESAIKGSFIVLFDDVVTTGHSMRDLKNKLENMGAIVVCTISIGRTYSDYHGENHQPHPYTGTL